MFIVGTELLNKRKHPIEHVYYEEFEDDEEELAWFRYTNAFTSERIGKYIMREYINGEQEVLASENYFDADITCGLSNYRTIQYTVDVYTHQYDYDDMKIAMIVQEFFTNHQDKLENEADFESYETVIKLCQEIRYNWLQLQAYHHLSDEEVGYIEIYTIHYLQDKFIKGDKNA